MSSEAQIDYIFYSNAGCMDGRDKDAGVEYVRGMHRDEPNIRVVVDNVCDGPGVVKLIAARDEAALAVFRERIEISDTHHKTRGVTISAHALCAGNPIERSEHLDQLKRAATVLRQTLDEMGKAHLPVIALWCEPGETGLFTAKPLSEVLGTTEPNAASVAA